MMTILRCFKLVKTIIESEQGQAFGEERFVREAGKRYFYIESYGCQMNFRFRNCSIHIERLWI